MAAKKKALGGEFTRNPPSSASVSWTAGAIRDAINAHDRGNFALTTALMHSTMRDPRILSAATQRVGTALGLEIEVRAAQRAWEGKPLAVEAGERAMDLLDDAGRCLPPSMQAFFLRTARCFMGIAVGQIEWVTSGTEWTPRVHEWPTEHVRHDPLTDTIQVRVFGGTWQTITPGDGQWIVYLPDGERSWMSAPVRALGLPWADRTYAFRDRSRRSEMAGLSTFMGTLPQGIRSNTADAAAFKTHLQNMQAGRGGLVKPFGYDVESLSIDSRGHEIFNDMIAGANEDFALAILGQSGTSTTTAGLGQGGNKVHDGVRYDLLEADVRTFYAGCIAPQLLAPWCMANWGRVDIMPVVSRCVPDPEQDAHEAAEDARHAAKAARYQAFAKSLADLRGVGIEPDIAKLAEEHGITIS